MLGLRHMRFELRWEECEEQENQRVEERVQVGVVDWRAKHSVFQMMEGFY